MKYTDPYSTDDGNQGQLLLSYPAIESFMLSCIKDNVVKMTSKLGTETKQLLTRELRDGEGTGKIGLQLTAVDLVIANGDEAEQRLIHAISEMNKGLAELGISKYDLDNLGDTLLKVYDCQQRKYNEQDTFSLISLVGMALLELGVIEEDESNRKEICCE